MTKSDYEILRHKQHLHSPLFLIKHSHENSQFYLMKIMGSRVGVSIMFTWEMRNVITQLTGQMVKLGPELEFPAF